MVIPNDATNGGRALLLLDKAGVIKLKDNKSITATPKDIVDNPKNIKIRELEAATLPRVLTQVDMALINTNYALEAKLNPTKDALAIEGSDSPYVNILVARPDNRTATPCRSWPRPCTAPRSSSSSRRNTKARWYRRSEPSRVTALEKPGLRPGFFPSRPYVCLPCHDRGHSAVCGKCSEKTFRHILNNLKNSLHNRPTFEDAPCKN